MATTKADILAALKGCRDPELGINIVDLGLIYDVEITGDTVKILMTLTTPGCPLQPYFQQDIEQRILAATDLKSVILNLTFDPPWSPAKMTEDAKKQLTLVR